MFGPLDSAVSRYHSPGCIGEQQPQPGTQSATIRSGLVGSGHGRSALRGLTRRVYSRRRSQPLCILPAQLGSRRAQIGAFCSETSRPPSETSRSDLHRSHVEQGSAAGGGGSPVVGAQLGTVVTHPFRRGTRAQPVITAVALPACAADSSLRSLHHGRGEAVGTTKVHPAIADSHQPVCGRRYILHACQCTQIKSPTRTKATVPKDRFHTTTKKHCEWRRLWLTHRARRCRERCACPVMLQDSKLRVVPAAGLSLHPCARCLVRWWLPQWVGINLPLNACSVEKQSVCSSA